MTPPERVKWSLDPTYVRVEGGTWKAILEPLPVALSAEHTDYPTFEVEASSRREAQMSLFGAWYRAMRELASVSEQRAFVAAYVSEISDPTSP